METPQVKDMNQPRTQPLAHPNFKKTSHVNMSKLAVHHQSTNSASLPTNLDQKNPIQKQKKNTSVSANGGGLASYFST